MSAKYIIRFDDLCPTADWPVWDQIERTLLGLDIRPLVGVVPDNRDDYLRVGDPDPRFWDRVRGWQSLGWSIGMHGYQHLCTVADGGILNINARSEFAGLPVAEQEEKIKRGLAIFRAEGITPTVFIPPAHSFDMGTISVMNKVGLGVLSDGFGALPYTDDHGVMRIPQQFWRFRWMPSGVWTICIHPNRWPLRDVRRFLERLDQWRDRLVDLETIRLTFQGRESTWWDSAADSLVPSLVRAKRGVRTWGRRVTAFPTRTPEPKNGENPS